MPHTLIAQPYRLSSILTVAFLCVGVLWYTASLTREYELERLHDRIEADLGRYALTLRSELDKFKSLPELIATQTQVRVLLHQQRNVLKIHALNTYLEEVSRITGASDIYLMNASGDTVAASNWKQDRSFVGKNFHYRPYFRQAMRGRPGHYFALGSTSGKRGYYFSHPVSIGGTPGGVLVVKVDLNDIEEQWNDPVVDLMVTDIDAVIFLSTRPEWTFKALQPLSESDLKRIVDSLRYANQPLSILPIVNRVSYAEGAELITLVGGQHARDADLDVGPDKLSGDRYMLVRQALPDAELNVVALAKMTLVERQVLNAVLVVGFILIILLLILSFVLMRRKIEWERARFKQQATQALEANEARVRAIIDNTQAGLITLDAVGCIESFNPTAVALFEYSPAEVSGRAFSTLIAQQDQAVCRRLIGESAVFDNRPSLAGEYGHQRQAAESAAVERASKGGEAIAEQVPVIEALACSRSGHQFPIELTVKAVRFADGTKYIATIHDISERKSYEENLRAARDDLEIRVAERTADLVMTNGRLIQESREHQDTQNELIQTAKMAVLGQLSAGINHELNQPLTAIRAYAENAIAFMGRGMAERGLDNLREIAGLTDRMAKIIAPLKVFARKTSGQVEPVGLKAVRNGATSILYGRLQTENIEILWDDALDDLYVMGDMVRLEQVMVNLITNAIQAMAGRPTKRIVIDCDCQDAFVSVHVTDNGPGIAEQDLEKVFEPFFTTKETGEGLGLGLSISHRIVESLGGQLSVVNAAAGGAQFRVKLSRAVARKPGAGRDMIG